MSLTLTSHIALLDPAGAALWSRPHHFTAWRRNTEKGAPLDALRALMAGQRGPLTLYLSGALAQPVSLRWVEGLQSSEEWQGYALNALSERFGRPASGWRLSWRLPRYGQAAMVAGMDPALWEQLATLPFKPAAVHPLLSTVMAHWARRLQHNDTLLLLERHTVQWALRGSRGWSDLGVLARPPAQPLASLLDTLRVLGIYGGEAHMVVADPDYLTLPANTQGWALPFFAAEQRT